MAPVKNFCSQADVELREARSRRAAQVNLEPSLTQQGHAFDLDINNIAKAFGLNTRNMPVPPAVFDPANYVDEMEAPRDLQSALNLVRDANDQFMALPVDLRVMFNHSPAALWDFVRNPANAAKAVELGLLVDRTPVVAPSPLAPPKNPMEGGPPTP